MRFTAGAEFEGALLRSFLKSRVGISTALLSRLKNKERGILQNGVRVTVRAILHEGDVIELAIEDEARNEKVPGEDIPLDILWENDSVVALNKPPFLATHPSSGHYTDTLANALVYRYGSCFHARFINRLDRNTSGVVLVAKNALAAATLSREMAKRNMEKIYYALVCGCVDTPFLMETGIRRKAGSVMLREVCPLEAGDLALTEAEPVFWGEDYSLVRLHPRTGRTHQLRVQLAHFGHPILGDDLYGTPSPLISRQALHAAELTFPTPQGEKVKICAPFPADMAELLRRKHREVPYEA